MSRGVATDDNGMVYVHFNRDYLSCCVDQTGTRVEEERLVLKLYVAVLVKRGLCWLKVGRWRLTAIFGSPYNHNHGVGLEMNYLNESLTLLRMASRCVVCAPGRGRRDYESSRGDLWVPCYGPHWALLVTIMSALGPLCGRALLIEGC